jgi:hypothetical protein
MLTKRRSNRGGWIGFACGQLQFDFTGYLFSHWNIYLRRYLGKVEYECRSKKNFDPLFVVLPKDFFAKDFEQISGSPT